MKSLLLLPLALLGTLRQAEPANDDPWPREIETPKARVVMYQPQIESSKGDRLTARAAVGVTRSGKDTPVFGVVWISARMATDRAAGLITFTDIDIPKVRFPEASKDDEQALAELLKGDMPKWDLSLTKEKLVAALGLAEREQARAGQFKGEAPQVVWRQTPTVLILIDGKPIEAATPDAEVARVVNSATFIARHLPSKECFLFLGDRWASSASPVGPWREAMAVPASVARQADQDPLAKAQKTEAAKEKKSESMPELLTATEPTELIVSDGEPQYAPVAGTGLLYVKNTDTDVIRDITTQSLYLLLSGRWFTSPKAEGPWTHVPSDKLPADFAKIPSNHPDLASVRSSVAGTPEAEEAILDAQVPQTAAVPRGGKDLKITYDGAPKWAKIEGLDAEFAENTPFSVFRVKGHFYCCTEAVWYESIGPNGPWNVATSIPPELNQLPASCPQYHCSYVTIYDSTPTYAWVGYTPGYTGCYVWGPTIIYGTGWYYRYWYGAYYYPRPLTFGVGVYYNPISGHWGVGFVIGRPYVHVSFGWSHWGGAHVHVHVGIGGHVGWHGWAGHSHAHINAHININHTTINVRNSNLYHDRPDVSPKIPDRGQLKDRPKPAAAAPKVPAVSDRANNVLSDRDGNVFKKEGNDFQQRDKGGWPQTPAAKIPDRSSQDMNRELQQRDRGVQRTNQTRSAPSGGGGGRRGGGRR